MMVFDERWNFPPRKNRVSARNFIQFAWVMSGYFSMRFVELIVCVCTQCVRMIDRSWRNKSAIVRRVAHARPHMATTGSRNMAFHSKRGRDSENIALKRSVINVEKYWQWVKSVCAIRVMAKVVRKYSEHTVRKRLWNMVRLSGRLEIVEMEKFDRE